MAISQDETLKGNEKIEEAILGLQKETSQEMLAHVLTVIRRRMNENGQVIVAVEMNPGNTQMAVKSVQTEDGQWWWYAFTSFDEEMKGPESVKSTFLTDIGKLFDAAMTVPEIEGVILNPWNRTIMLDKHLIRIIKPENKEELRKSILSPCSIWKCIFRHRVKKYGRFYRCNRGEPGV